MAKKKIKWGVALMWVVGILISLGVGGLFINKTFENTIILSVIPDFVHQIAGWLIILSTIGGAIYTLYKRFIK